MARPTYPAPLGMMLALRVMIHPTEMDRSHQLQIQLQDADGQRIAQIDAVIGVGDPGQIEPGEEASVPIPIGLPSQAQLPRATRYSFELLIDGIHQASVPFTAIQADQPLQIGGPSE